jgi:hypothetical protein
MVTQSEYDTNMNQVYDAMRLDKEQFELMMGRTHAYVWGPAKDYALETPKGRPFISNVFHIKSRVHNEADAYEYRNEWYHALTGMGFARFVPIAEEEVQCRQEYERLQRLDVEIRSDERQAIYKIDVYLHAMTNKEIQVIFVRSGQNIAVNK